ncbi:hypothetical protein ACMD2_23702 [Ananas comosus]|uniref:Uncharacterized protein n=1 Tax=Ananas comosus TaxID=4615 RepID=A0A199VFT7_ANACO|nr:hypothetical protein ACMD2_23702 [Ananas comosus]
MGGAGWAAGAAAGAATAIIGTGRAVGAAAGGAIGGAGQAVGAAIGGTGQVVGTVAEKVGAGASEGARRMKGAMPDREHLGTICRIAWRITDHALAEFTRPYTCGIPVYRYLKEELAKGGADSKEKKDRKQEAAGKW